MSSYYGVIFPEFWTGRSGRDLRAHGKDAQLLGLYLATNRHANMIGLYRVLVDDIRHETGLGAKGLEKGFMATAAADYATYDAGSSFVWVRNMARFRLAIKVGEALDPDDKKVTAINRVYHAIDPNPFLGEFFDVNHRMLRLKKRRDSVGVVVSLSGHHHISGLPSPFDAPPKPGTENRDQKTEIRDQKKARRRASTQDTPAENRNVIRALVFDLVKREAEHGHAFEGLGFADLKDLAKEACARKGLAYDPDVVGSALEQAIARKGKAS